MSAAQDTPGHGIVISLHIGQRVRHRDYKGQRVTGIVHGLSLDSDRVLEADIVLDAPIVVPARNEEDRALSIWRQHVPAHELAPFDDRDELIAEMLAALHGVVRVADRATVEFDAARTVIAKATGSAA
ncbi:hypothetical protein [Variovorax sp. EBFNA2]|uniref:hypothetical protein n=1 Tax=Variovorax sp. EBFNA2 TaxID=3342097 RepID=UPI0029C07AC4|nr:hypothetical protein [Variovorax boronicumulans]WPG35156.1 hypothetical protein RZE79_16825 [Variovorax boronicumulans]